MTGDRCFPRALARVLILALCVAVLGGCSLVRIGYNYLDTIAVWTADDYFDLDSDQRRAFATRFDPLHAWHRYEQLPDYAAFLTATRARMEKGLTREDFLWIVDGMSERYRTLMRRSADDVAALLLTVTPEQLNVMQRQLDKDNRRFIREYQLEESVEEQRRASARRALVRIRDWAGSLTHEQEQQIATLASEVPWTHRMRHEDRLRRQREFLQLMQQRDNPREFTARLRHWLVNFEEGRNPEYHQAFVTWTQKQGDYLAGVDRILTASQRASVLNRLQGYIDDFTRLAQRPATRAAASR